MSGLDSFAFVLSEAWNIMNMPFELFGFGMSFAQVFIYTTFAGVLMWIVAEIFDL